MITIGLTGNISSGKSAVSRYLAEAGAKIIDADMVSRDIVLPGKPALKEITGRFGPGVLDAAGRLDRKRLGALVFTDPEAMGILNNITHPHIVAAIEKEKREYISANRGDMLVIDAPLLIETGLHQGVDEIWVVTIDPRQQIERLMRRDGISEAEAQKKVDAQMPQEEKAKYAHRIIDNSGDLEDTITQVKKLLAMVGLALPI